MLRIVNRVRVSAAVALPRRSLCTVSRVCVAAKPTSVAASSIAVRATRLTSATAAAPAPYAVASRAMSSDSGIAPKDGSFLTKPEVTERIMTVVKAFDKVDSAKVTPTAHFSKDLGLDSLDVVEVVMSFEDEFKIEIADADAEKMHSIPDAVNYITAHPAAK